MTVKTDYKYIELTPQQVPIIAGTTLKVVELIEAHQAYHWTPEQIQEQHPQLRLSQIHSAFAYYWDHKAELDGDIERRFEAAEAMRHTVGESPLVARLRAQGLLP